MSEFATREGLLMLALGETILNKVMKDETFISSLPFEFDASESEQLERKLKKMYLPRGHDSKDPESFAIEYFSDVDIIGGVQLLS